MLHPLERPLLAVLERQLRAQERVRRVWRHDAGVTREQVAQDGLVAVACFGRNNTKLREVFEADVERLGHQLQLDYERVHLHEIDVLLFFFNARPLLPRVALVVILHVIVRLLIPFRLLIRRCALLSSSLQPEVERFSHARLPHDDHLDGLPERLLHSQKLRVQDVQRCRQEIREPLLFHLLRVRQFQVLLEREGGLFQLREL
mmetsp:Transcript_12843/g.21804  ORF Transcript_12843/g.21804 Transcript_12843/m.21804 type:complete len:203 (+) Transcript_12843:1155-1763(+)